MKHANPSEFLTKPQMRIMMEPNNGTFTIANLRKNDLDVVCDLYTQLFTGRNYTETHEMVEGHYVLPGQTTFQGHFEKVEEALVFIRGIEHLEYGPKFLSTVANSLDNLDTDNKRIQGAIQMGRLQKPSKSNEPSV